MEVFSASPTDRGVKLLIVNGFFLISGVQIQGQDDLGADLVVAHGDLEAETATRDDTAPAVGHDLGTSAATERGGPDQDRQTRRSGRPLQRSQYTDSHG